MAKAERCPFLRILFEYQGQEVEALRRILELEGNIDLLNRYADKTDPLWAYGWDTIGTSRTNGQEAVMWFMAEQVRQR